MGGSVVEGVGKTDEGGGLEGGDPCASLLFSCV